MMWQRRRARRVSFWEYLSSRRGLLIFETYQHASMVAQCVVIAALIGVALAVASYRTPPLAAFITGSAAVFYTIPSFALFGLLIPIVGLGVAPSVIALVIYSLLPIIRNSVVGLVGVDKSLVEAARGMGMSRTTTLLRVELPLAWPVILTGLRVATQLAVGVGAIAAYVTGPGLGEQIFSGLARLGAVNSINATVTGTVLIALLAVFFDLLYVGLGRLTIPREVQA